MQDLLTKADLAGMFKVTESTIAKWVKGGDLPPPSVHMNQKAKYWYASDIASFINNKDVENENTTSVNDPGFTPELQERRSTDQPKSIPGSP